MIPVHDPAAGRTQVATGAACAAALLLALTAPTAFAAQAPPGVPAARGGGVRPA
ncbi:hypothetical protein ABT093_16295 [Kitasatospora sp. NPDC002551]|uniref:hypothetical protein n=1 Tax=Kitasatospora sp. NPDC002551 TaxID=3154539 RepID=UPI003328BF9C